MNKTITINISGIIFYIEEYAYEVLNEYLNSLKRHFSNTEGGDEIINDIESRIAEIFQTKVGDKKQVILIEEVNEVIDILGKPENFYNAEEEKNNNSDSRNKNNEYFKTKRLYRDAENKVLGGVCSGLGHYFGLDPVWFRLAFILALIFFGSSFIVYLILWVIIPKALTTAEKLEMKGERVNISDIEKNIKEELEELKKRFYEFKRGAKSASKEEFDKFKKEMHNVKNEANDFYKSDSVHNVLHKLIYVFVNIIKYAVKAFIMFLGIVILAIAIALIVGLIISLCGPTNHIFLSHGIFASVSIPAIANFLFNTSQQANLAIIGICLLIGIPLLMMIFGGIKLIFGIKRRVKIISISGLILWLTGIFICVFIAFDISQQFSEKANSKNFISLNQPKDSTMYLELSNKNIDTDKFENTNNKIHFDNCFIASYDGEEGKQKIFGMPKLKIIKSGSGLFELQIIKSSYGLSVTEAKKISEKINYKFNQKDSLLLLDNYFTLDENGKWRNQDVKIILKVPVGKMIIIDNNIENILCNYDNEDDILCSDIENKKFVMTDNGFVPKL